MFATQLAGKELPGGWIVNKAADLGPNPTGGGFSVGYIVKHRDGHEAFLKALDYSAAFDAPGSPAPILDSMTAAYNFECDMYTKCKNKAMDRVVHAIDKGTIIVIPGLNYSKVDYLIFELARGDIRKIMDTQTNFDHAFALRALHHTAVGLRQLHASDMAHQDLKPSNILVFDGHRGSKIADLGRGWSKDLRAKHDEYDIPGAKPYAPPEFIYRGTPTDESMRRFGYDIYLLGNMICFFFARTTMTGLMHKHLSNGVRPLNWNGSYSSLLPYLQEAFANALKEFHPHAPEQARDDLVSMLKQLCDPDPEHRGHPLDKGGSRFSLERYVSRLNLLAYRAECRFAGNKGE